MREWGNMDWTRFGTQSDFPDYTRATLGFISQEIGQIWARLQNGQEFSDKIKLTPFFKELSLIIEYGEVKSSWK